MLITVTRTNKSADGTFGHLVIDLSTFRCVTLENLAQEIPAGTYDLLYMWSEHFQQIMPHVIVPGRTAIEVHWANYPKELEGCIALGTAAEFSADCIDESKVAWKGFVQAISDQPAIKLKVVEDFA